MISHAPRARRGAKGGPKPPRRFAAARTRGVGQGATKRRAVPSAAEGRSPRRAVGGGTTRSPKSGAQCRRRPQGVPRSGSWLGARAQRRPSKRGRERGHRERRAKRTRPRRPARRQREASRWAAGAALYIPQLEEKSFYISAGRGTCRPAAASAALAARL